MKYCCEPFFNALDNAGNKGFSIILTDCVGMLRYAIQTRLCDYSQQDEMSQILVDKEISLPLVILKRITFCPFCGKKLERLIMPNSPEARQLTEAHAKYTVK